LAAKSGACSANRFEANHVDSDLADAVEALKAVFAKRKISCSFGKSPPALVDDLRKQLRIPSRFRNFLSEANPEKVETVTPVERIRLIPAEELLKIQKLVQTPSENGSNPLDWKASWVVVGESALLGDPYFLDVSKPDPEGDCPIYTAMSGQDRWAPTLAASSFAQFLRILSTAMEIASGFGDAIMDDEDEDAFREALGPKVKVIDAAALRAGHWT
jgi:SMI1/KNR4 family protein SUKH-1